MTSGPSGKHAVYRRSVSSDKWPFIDRAAWKLADGTGSALARRLLEEAVTDTDKAIETCRRIAAALSKRSET